MTGPAAMLSLLRDLEWSGRSGIEGEDACCPECGACQNEIEQNRDDGSADEWGHGVTCRLSRFVHGDVSAAQLAKIAAAKAESKRRRREYEAKSPAEQDAMHIEMMRRRREMEEEIFNAYVRAGGAFRK